MEWLYVAVVVAVVPLAPAASLAVRSPEFQNDRDDDGFRNANACAYPTDARGRPRSPGTPASVYNLAHSPRANLTSNLCSTAHDPHDLHDLHPR
jgi:hypothetical protein